MDKLICEMCGRSYKTALGFERPDTCSSMIVMCFQCASAAERLKNSADDYDDEELTEEGGYFIDK